LLAPPQRNALSTESQHSERFRRFRGGDFQAVGVYRSMSFSVP
jgi:hypothetical protein